jgi:hypothetical protein
MVHSMGRCGRFCGRVEDKDRGMVRESCRAVVYHYDLNSLKEEIEKSRSQ